MTTPIGPFIQAGTARSVPLPNALQSAPGTEPDFRATLDQRVQGRDDAPREDAGPRGPEGPDRASPNASDETRPGRAESDDAPKKTAGETEDAAPPTDESDQAQEEQGAEGEAGTTSTTGPTETTAASVAALSNATQSESATKETANTVTANSQQAGDGQVGPRTNASTQQSLVSGAQSEGQATGEQSAGADNSGEPSLRGRLAGDALKGADSSQSGDANESVKFADRLGARLGEQAGQTQASDGRAVETQTKPVDIGAQTANSAAKPTLANVAKADTSSVQAQQVDDRASVASVNRGLAAVVKQNGGSVTIKLTPESLGPVKIQMSIEGGRVDLRFDAATDQARDMLLRNADMLRQNLQGKGLSVERMQAHTAPVTTESTDGRGAQQRQDQQEQSQRQDAGREQSRGYNDRRGEHQDGRQQWRERPENFTSAWRVALNATA